VLAAPLALVFPGFSLLLSDMLRRRIQNPLKMLSRSVSSTPKLPRLPVPDLRKTLNKYLTSLEPFLLEDELRGGMSFNSAYALRKKWADEFELGIGTVLQERLVGSSS